MLRRVCLLREILKKKKVREYKMPVTQHIIRRNRNRQRIVDIKNIVKQRILVGNKGQKEGVRDKKYTQSNKKVTLLTGKYIRRLLVRLVKAKYIRRPLVQLAIRNIKKSWHIYEILLHEGVYYMWLIRYVCMIG